MSELPLQISPPLAAHCYHYPSIKPTQTRVVTPWAPRFHFRARDTLQASSNRGKIHTTAFINQLMNTRISPPMRRERRPTEHTVRIVPLFYVSPLPASERQSPHCRLTLHLTAVIVKRLVKSKTKSALCS